MDVYVKSHVRVYVNAEIFYVFAGSDGGIVKKYSGIIGNFFDMGFATNRDTWSFIFI